MLFPDIDPVALTVGGWPVRWYGLMYLVGIWAGWLWARRQYTYFPGLSQRDVDDFIPWLIGGVIIGGRLGYVFFYDPLYFMAHPLDILKTWEGGMSFHGGVMGVGCALLWYAARRQIPVSSFSDNLVLCVPVGLFFGRIGNLVNQEVCGRMTDMPWALIFPRVDIFPRHPSQIYEALLEGLLLFVILNTAAPALSRKPWTLTALFLVGYGTARFVCELYRLPDHIYHVSWFTITQGQLLSLPMILGGGFLLWWQLRRRS